MANNYQDNDDDLIGSQDSIAALIDLPPGVNRSERRAKRRRRFGFLLKLFGFFFVLLVVVGLIGGVWAYFFCKPRYDLANSFDLSQLEDVEVASRIFDKNGVELGRIFDQNRRPVSLDNVSEDFINALLASEDSRFYLHDGVDYMGILRAAYYGVRSKSLNQGASTITQQLARQTFELKDKTMSRKLTEVFLAWRIEKAIGSKQKILELYLNRIYFGSGYYGIASAAEGYFGKDASRLNVIESATLVAAIPNPYHRSPRSFPQASQRWRNHVLSRMQAEGYIDMDTMTRSQKAEVVTIARTNITGNSPYVYEAVRQQVIELMGEDAVSKGGLSIHTTIDSTIQRLAEKSLQEQLSLIEQHPDFKHETLASYKAEKAKFQASAHPDQRFPTPRYLQGALLMIDNRTGAILATVGGRDFSDSMFNRVVQGRRPTGTAFKPFVYAAAFEKGFFPGTLVDDTPMDARQVMVGGMTGILGEWGPENINNVYENVITSRRALSMSKNAATVRLGQKVGTEAVVALAQKAGLRFQGDLQKFNATFLGRNPASPEELCLAYTIFPNQGKRPEKTHIITSVRNAAGEVLYEPHVNLAQGRAIDEFTSYQISSILSDSLRVGAGSKAMEKHGLGDYAVAGKTGTEYDFTDNWFAGYTSQVTCVAWVGFDQTRTIFPGSFSSDTVLPVWTKVMNQAAEIYTPRPFVPPAGAEQVEICVKSGELASDGCYELDDKGNGIVSQVRSTYKELMRPGTKLEAICHIHGRPGSRIRDTPDLTEKGIFRPRFVVDDAAEPVLPIAATIIADADPYYSIQPVLRARVAPAVVEAVEEEPEDVAAVDDDEARPMRAQPVDANGLPLARPVIDHSDLEAMPDNRVRLDTPRAIQIIE